jgi:hypothetical protein
MSQKINEVRIDKLFPTQLTVGFIEVKEKEKKLHSMTASNQKEFLRANPVPAVIGMGGNLYITDHHHLCRAAYDAGITHGFIFVEDDLSSIKTADKFWVEMAAHKWVHPLDSSGTRHLYSSIPHHISHLVDDVYRSLAGYVRHAGGYEKTPTAFAEFVWADFFRRNIAVEDVNSYFSASVKIAKKLAHGEMAIGLPGYIFEDEKSPAPTAAASEKS